MTQDERWQQQYEQMMAFMNENHRRPSKHRLEEHDMLNWYKATKKRIAKGELSEDRLEKFKTLQEIAEKLHYDENRTWALHEKMQALRNKKIAEYRNNWS